MSSHRFDDWASSSTLLRGTIRRCLNLKLVHCRIYRRHQLDKTGQKHVVTNKQNETNTISKMPARRWLAQAVWTALSASKAANGALALLLGGGVSNVVADNNAPRVAEEIAVPGTIRAGSPVRSLSARAAQPWTLERALAYALVHNPDARIAQQRIAAAQAGLEQANSAFWPRLQVESSYTRTDNPMLAFGDILNQRSYSSSLNLNDVPDVDNLNARGIVTVPLYAGGRNVAERQSARANTAAAKQESEAVRNALGFEVSRAFHTVLKTRKFIRAADAAVSSFEANLVVARRRLDGGTLLKSDVLDIEVRQAQAREDLVRASNASTLAERALRNLLGIEAGEFTVADTVPVVRAPSAGDFAQRPELAAARERANAAEAQVRGSKSGYQPRVSAFGSLGYDYGWVTGGDGGNYTAGVLARWDLWDGFSTRSKVREARANLESAREEERRLRLAVGLEVDRARLDLKTAVERLAVSSKTVEQADESANLIQNRFDQGLALPTQLIDAETALVAARVRRAEAESDERIAVSALRRALALPQLDPQPVAR
jgi:outer membrane protein TolC